MAAAREEALAARAQGEQVRLQAEQGAEEQARKATTELSAQIEGLHASRTKAAETHTEAIERLRQSEASRVEAVEARLAEERGRALKLESALQAVDPQ